MPAPPSRAVKLCGTTAIDSPSRQLGSGRLAVELENGQLCYVRYGGVEVLRSIAFLVRDEDWGTYSPQIENLDIQERAEGFAVSYRAVCSDAAKGEAVHAWHKSLLHSVVPALIREWEAKLGVKVNGYFLQRMKTKSGSCNHRGGNIRLNTELVKKPKDLLEYVIVHEMAHLLEFDPQRSLRLDLG